MMTVLTIAGFDPSSGAGVTADLAVFAAHGLYGTSAITALTVQSTLGVEATHRVPRDVLGSTLACLHTDLPPVGIKIGMLGTAGCVAAVAEYLESVRQEGGNLPVVVLDPVLRSSSGRDLLDGEGLAVMRERLMPLVHWVTPNSAELAALNGAGHGAGRTEVAAAARSLRDGFPGLSVVVTGGDFDPPDDLLLTGQEEIWLPGTRVETTSTHGTGCAFSSALLSRLVLGDTPVDAAQKAKRYVAEALSRAIPIGHGRGPMNHLWPLRPLADPR
jgi:hydroxymethylpyrimidine/phosphomethylpyrimidine kinase